MLKKVKEEKLSSSEVRERVKAEQGKWASSDRTSLPLS
jgi:hypothetical protein